MTKRKPAAGRRDDWSLREIKAAVVDGLHMLKQELAGQQFNKAVHAVTEDLTVRVSPRIREEFHDGREYHQYVDSRLRIAPTDLRGHRAPDVLRWQNERFLA